MFTTEGTEATENGIFFAAEDAEGAENGLFHRGGAEGAENGFDVWFAAGVGTRWSRTRLPGVHC